MINFKFSLSLLIVVFIISYIDCGENGVKNINKCSEKVCYDDIGCFEPWESSEDENVVSICPQSPLEINTKFLVFNSDEPNVIKTPQDIPHVSKVVFFIHGYTSSYNGSEEQIHLKNELLKKVRTVVMIDYKEGADPGIKIAAGLLNYLQASCNTRVVGREVGNMIARLISEGKFEVKNVHIIGFSLGAQVTHFASQWLQNNFNIKIGRVTGLDPAAPLFKYTLEQHINYNDADFVDIIHTSEYKAKVSNIVENLKGSVGIFNPIGHIDFYPNGGGENGTVMPGCAAELSWCSHNYAVKLMAASVNKCNFQTCKAESYNQFKQNDCILEADNFGYNSIRYPKLRGKFYISSGDEPLEDCIYRENKILHRIRNMGQNAWEYIKSYF